MAKEVGGPTILERANFELGCQTHLITKKTVLHVISSIILIVQTTQSITRVIKKIQSYWTKYCLHYLYGVLSSTTSVQTLLRSSGGDCPQDRL